MELIIRSVSEKEILGRVSQNRAGNFAIKAKDRIVKRDIADMVERVASANPVLPLRSGRKTVEQGRVRYESTARQCRRGEPNYLYALAEHITQREFRSRNEIAGKEIQAFVQE